MVSPEEETKALMMQADHESAIDVAAEKAKALKVKAAKYLDMSDLKKIGFPIVKQDFAKANMAKLDNTPQSEADELFAEARGMKGAVPKLNQEETAKVVEEQQKINDEADELFREAGLSPLRTKNDERSIGSKALRGALTTLSLTEIGIVKGIYKTVGLLDKVPAIKELQKAGKNIFLTSGSTDKLPEKEDLLDYNYTTLLEDLGAPKSPMTNAAGLALSIFGTPETYLSFGVTGLAKLGAKAEITLSAKGLKVAGELTKARLAENVASQEARLGRQLTRDQANVLQKQEQRKVERELVGHFKKINDQKTAIRVSKEVKELPASVFDQGGIKFAGHSILTGDEVAKIIDQSGLPKAMEVLQKSGDALRTNKVSKPFMDTMVDPFIRETVAAKELVSKMFIPHYGVDAGLVKNWREIEAESRAIQNRIYKRQEQWFSGLNKEQREDFADSAIKASLIQTQADRVKDTLKNLPIKKGDNVVYMGLRTKGDKVTPGHWTSTLDHAVGFSNRRAMNGKIKVGIADDKGVVKEVGKFDSKEFDLKRVTSLKGDSAVQDRLDRFYAQGKYEGRTSIADKLAEKSKLLEDADAGPKLLNWFPGVDRFYSRLRLELPKKFDSKAQRDFLLERGGNPDNYIRNPVKALAFRRTQIAFANLQDKMYDGIVKNKLGELKTFSSPLAAMEHGYVRLSRPMGKAVMDEADYLKRFKESPVYVKKEFNDQYEDLVRSKTNRIPIISPITDLFKTGVTTVFPAFHARNFNSNIVLNSMSIGGHAFDKALYDDALNFIRGQNLTKEYTTAFGKRVTGQEIINEAVREGVIKKGQFISDIGGELLDKETRGAWEYITHRVINPLSSEWGPYKVGRKFGEEIESQARMVNYLTWRKKGLSPKVAAAEVGNALFDYGNITQFEQAAKNIIPFYTFTKKNLERHIKVLAQRPGVIAAQMKLFRDLGPTEKEWEALPQWAQRKLVVKWKDMAMTGFGLPLEDLVELTAEPLKEIMVRTNPIFRYPLEVGTGKDFFTGRDVGGLNNAKEFKFIYDSARDPKMNPFFRAGFEKASKFLELQKDHKGNLQGDPDVLHILRSSFTSRAQSMLGLIQDKDVSTRDAVLRLTLGLNRLEPDQSRALSESLKRNKEKLTELVQKTNSARVYEVQTYLGGKFDPAADFANDYMHRLEEGLSVKTHEKILNDATKILEKLQQKRIQPKVKKIDDSTP